MEPPVRLRMEISITRQAAQAAMAFALGTAMGLSYDFIKAFRLRMHSRFATAFFDALYCLPAALCLFAFGLGPGEGQLRLFMLVFVGLGASVYSFLLSKYSLAVFGYFAKAAAAAVRPPLAAAGKCAVKLKKYLKSKKNIFQKIILWFTIIDNCKRDKPFLKHGSGGSEGFETEKGKYIYQNSHHRPDTLCDSKSRGGTRQGGRSRIAPRGASAAGYGNNTAKRRTRVSDRSRHR
ncbi:MAG: hypothetical protein EOM54_00530 [Clostridia bacterium]|nr:hypothetical protein [Clostridia bacterium]